MMLNDMTLTALSAALQAGKCTSRSVTEAYLACIDAVEDSIGAYLTIDRESALRQADASDTRRDAGAARGPLDGVPMALKDNICVQGGYTTCASRMLADFVSPYSATAWARLEKAGCVLLGKTNMDEFAMGDSTAHSAFHPTRNPHDLTRVPGGSSGGSAAAVAAGEAAFALGSDTGGSIRQPAAFCGVVGMKPTYGAVSRHGLVAFASSLEQIGPLTRTVADNALVLDALVGADPLDSTCLNRAWAPMGSMIGQDVRGLRIGLPKEMLGDGVSPEVRSAVMNAAHALEAQGATLVDVQLPMLEHALPAYYVISSAEASSNLARYDGVRFGFRAETVTDLEDLYIRSRTEGFGAEVRRRILLGTFALSAGQVEEYYTRALQVRTLVIGDMTRALTAADVLLGPVAPTTAWPLGQQRTPLQTWLGDVYTVPANIAGVPALSVPCGQDAAGMPIGVQLMGSAFSEPMLYRVGHALEAALNAKEVR